MAESARKRNRPGMTLERAPVPPSMLAKEDMDNRIYYLSRCNCTASKIGIVK